MARKRAENETAIERVSAEDFVTIWQGSGSVGEAADKLGLSNRSASGRAAVYRKHGVELKAMPGGANGPRNDYDALAKLAKKLAKAAA